MLTFEQNIYGISTISFALLDCVVGMKIISAYIKSKDKNHLTVGLTWIFLTSPWWGVIISFMNMIIFNTRINDFLFLFLNNAFLPIAIILWLYSFVNFFIKEHKNLLILIVLVVFGMYEAIFLILLTIDTKNVGIVVDFAFWNGTLFISLYLLTLLIIAFITGIIFSWKIWKTRGKTDIETRLFKKRGVFLILAWTFLFLGAVLDVLFFDSFYFPFDISLAILYMVSGICYYLGFFFKG